MALSDYTCTGRFVADPEFRLVGQEQREIATFTLAVDRDRKNEDGSRDADFLDFVAWRSAAKCLKNCHKGDLITLSHIRPITRNYVDKDGNKRRKIEFEVSGLKSDIYFGSRRRDTHDNQIQSSYADDYGSADEETPF